MIQARNIQKSYGKLSVLKGVDFDVKQGEFVSIVGASGAGKTTLLQILGSLDRPDGGDVIINETSVFALKDKELSRFRNTTIGFVFQFHQLLPEFTALENICIPAFIGKKTTAEAEKKAKELLDYLGLIDRFNHKPAELSGGEQQRVAIARSLVNDPKVILADEPTGNLDSHNASELQALLLKLRQELNQTIVVVTHNEKFANDSDRIVRITDGKIINE